LVVSLQSINQGKRFASAFILKTLPRDVDCVPRFGGIKEYAKIFGDVASRIALAAKASE